MDTIRYVYAEHSGLEIVLSQPGRRVYPWHIHTEHWNAGLVLAGTVIVHTAHTAPVRFLTGQAFYIAPCAPHSLETSADTHLAIVCIPPVQQGKYDPQPFERICKAAGLCTALRNRLSALVQACPEQVPGQELPDDIRQTLRHIVLHLAEPLPLQELARQAGYSRWHFLRRFHAATGMTPQAFIRECRLRHARGLLRADTAAADAAVSAGFSDQSHLSKLFRQYHGLTPKSFRQASIKLPL